MRKILAKYPGDEDTSELLKQCLTVWLKRAETMRKNNKWEDALIEYRQMNVSFPNDEKVTRQFRITESQRRLQDSRKLLEKEDYSGALKASREAEKWARGVPALEEEAAGLSANINAVIEKKYSTYVAKAKELMGNNNLKEAKTALVQAFLLKKTDEIKALTEEVDDRLSTPDGMVYIPAGICIIGDSTQELWKKEGPAHKVNLLPYFIDKHSVTNVQYMEFVKETGYRKPQHWEKAGNRIPPGEENHPVTHVNLADAQSYAKWAKKRLPAEAEWEKAARGPNGRIYPWGNEYKVKMANDENAGAGSPSTVGSDPQGTSPYGCLDMAGNVWEWTTTKFYLYPESEGELERGEEKLYVIKGGCFMDDKLFLRSSFRETVGPDSSYAIRATLGFRCALDVKR